MNPDEYKKVLLDLNNTLDNINKYIQPFIPKSIFKYYNFNSEYWEKTIFSGQVYLAKASNFNDPLDCYLHCNENIVLKSPLFRKQVIDQYPMIFDTEFDLYNDELKQVLAIAVQETIRVACFSEKWNSILMWSHYANCHRGYCIEYDTEKMSSLKKKSLYPVLYQNEPIDITENLAKLKRNTGYITVLSKSVDWNYEKEWRILTFNENNDSMYFRKEMKSITLGLKCDGKERKEIYEWARDKDVIIYQAEILPGKYEIIRKRVI